MTLTDLETPLAFPVSSRKTATAGHGSSRDRASRSNRSARKIWRLDARWRSLRAAGRPLSRSRLRIPHWHLSTNRCGAPDMTDHPRFQLIDGEYGERHRHYHGALAVDLVLHLADWWLSLPGQRHVGHRSEPLRAPGQARLSAAQLLSQLPQASVSHQRRPHEERG